MFFLSFSFSDNNNSNVWYFLFNNIKANISVGFKETQDEEGHGGLSGGTKNVFLLTSW